MLVFPVTFFNAGGGGPPPPTSAPFIALPAQLIIRRRRLVAGGLRVEGQIPANIPAPTTWSATDFSTGVVISGGGLTAQNGAATSDSLVRSNTSKTTGKNYCECTMTSVNSEGAFGIANATESLSNYLGQTNNSIGIYKSGHVFLNGSNILNGPSFASGDTMGMDIDEAAALIWFRNNNAPTVWNAGGTADPATGLGGISIAAVTGAHLICANMGNQFGTVTLKAVGPFGQAAPSGSSAWGQ